MDPNQITNFLSIILVIAIIILFILIILYVIVSRKSKNQTKERKENIKTNKKRNSKDVQSKTGLTDPKSIEEFMEFEDVQDNMIIQKGKSKYIMVVECQGVNYDLMSEMEKNAVEEGFLQFLNTLRHPIQLYVQTRTVNLESSISSYKAKVAQAEAELMKRKQQYEMIKDNPNVSEDEKRKVYFSLVKQTNLFEYGKDIIADTENMNLNKNILNKKYYVIIPYYPSDLGENNFDESEIRSIAFSELYTKSQAIIRTLSACDVKGKILNTKELIELLYVAYNRDHEEEFNLNRAMQAQYDKLFVTAEDVYQKELKELDKRVEEEAIERAKEKVNAAKSDIEKEVEKRKSQMDNLIDEMAKIILEENKTYIGENIADKAIEKIENEATERKSKRKKEVS